MPLWDRRDHSFSVVTGGRGPSGSRFSADLCGFGGMLSARFNASSRRLAASSSVNSSWISEAFVMTTLDGKQTIQLLRGQAIGAHAILEMHLCNLFHHLLKTDLEAAGIAFYSVKNARQRNGMIEELLELRHGNAYSLFWNSWKTKCQQIDGRRNSIAHWIMSTSHKIEGAIAQPPKTTLKRPTCRTSGNWHPISEITEQGLENFIEECEDLAFIIRLFHEYLADGDLRGREPQTLHDIFQQPITYPIPSDSPLSRNYTIPENPPPPSQA